jgi:hypothetical protein
MNPSADPQPWIETFRELVRHYALPLEPSAPLGITCLLAVLGGLFLVFRGAKSERMIVSCFAAVFGGYVGWQVAELVGVPGPIAMSVLGVVLTLIAFRTYRYWLAVGSVVVLFAAALMFQLGRGDLTRYLPKEQGLQRDGGVRPPPSPEDQQRNLHDQAAVQIEKMKELVVGELTGLGPLGWLVPLLAAIVGVMLAVWALRIFVVIWLGLIGAIGSVLGAVTLLTSAWPSVRDAVLSDPRITAGAMAALWILGLIFQAKQARLPKRLPVPLPAGAQKAGAPGA